MRCRPRAADRPPSVHGKTSLYRGKISVRFDDFTHDEPHEDKRHERGQRADSGKHPRKIGKYSSPPGIVHQNGKIALPFCLTLHKYLLYIKFVIANHMSKKYSFFRAFILVRICELYAFFMSSRLRTHKTVYSNAKILSTVPNHFLHGEVLFFTARKGNSAVGDRNEIFHLPQQYRRAPPFFIIIIKS